MSKISQSLNFIKDIGSFHLYLVLICVVHNTTVHKKRHQGPKNKWLISLPGKNPLKCSHLQT